MYFKKPFPRRARLEVREEALMHTSRKASRDHDARAVRAERLVTRVAAASPETAEAVGRKISTSVTIMTEPHGELSSFFANPALVSMINSEASLGAWMVSEGGKDRRDPAFQAPRAATRTFFDACPDRAVRRMGQPVNG